MPTVLPLQINALYLESPEQVIGQDVRFENVPWMNIEKDVFENPNVPLETNSIIPRPFSYDNAIYLYKGVHLHFVLPSHFKKFDDKGDLPKAPNRWHVKRERDSKEWIVESDYIWNVNDLKLNKYMTCSYLEGEAGQDFQFKYVGKKYKFEEWSDKDSTGNNYLNHLSALGWGSFSFDTHYPNCRSIFGFYDEEGSNEDTYMIVGWVEANAQSAVDESIVAGKFCLQPAYHEEIEDSFDIAIANTLPETISALIINKNNPALTNLDLQKQEEQIASILAFDELKDLSLDWISRLRHKQHEQQFNKTSGTTKYVLNIVDAKGTIQEYDFDVSLIDFEFSKSIADQYESIEQRLVTLNAMVLSEQDMSYFFDGLNLKDLNDISFNRSLDDKLVSLNKELNNSELEAFRLHTEIESLYLHWSTYLNDLFLKKDSNINKLKEDLKLLISQIGILKEKHSKSAKKTNELHISLSREISKYYTRYCDNKILKFLVKPNEDINDKYRSQLRTILNQRYETQVVLSKTAKTNYYTALPPSVIVSSSKKNTIFNLFTNPPTPETLSDITSFDPNDYSDYIKIINQCERQVINVNNWHTYKVEWEGLFLPKKDGHYLGSANGFEEGFLINSFTLDELNADLVKQYTLADVAYLPNPNIYYGQSFVSNTVKEYVQEKLSNNSVPIDNEENAHLKSLIQDFSNKLDDISLFELTLSDFNNLLFQRSNGLSILPFIPNGFKDHKELAKSIEALCKEYANDLNLLTPNRLSTFNPFRNGAFRVSRLRIIDSFGRDKVIEPHKVITTHVQKIENKDNWVALPPRYLQAATMSTRFTSTISNKQKSPVVGWMIPVYLNQHIEFFDADGKHLGAINTDGQWESSPFDVTIAEKNTDYKSVVKNPHLKRIIHWIIEKVCKSNAKSEFIEELQKAMAHTAPEDYANPSLLETISSIPIAITWVNINLFTKGEAHYDINYSDKISINTYDNQRKFDKVKIPMSIGDLNQYNDGVLAYWHYNINEKDVESDEKLGLKHLESRIYFNNEENRKKGGNTYSLNNFLRENPFDGRIKWNEMEPVKKTSPIINYKNQDKESYLGLNDTLSSCQRYVLMHPKGNLHIKTGILPENSIKLPYNKIKHALKRIELTLLTTPIITPKDNLELSLVKDNRYEWSWIELEKKDKKKPLSINNPPVKKRITQKLALDFNIGFDTETHFESLIEDLKSRGLLISYLGKFFQNEKIYFVDKNEFVKHDLANRYRVELGLSDFEIRSLRSKDDYIRSRKVAFDLSHFKSKADEDLLKFILKEKYAFQSSELLLDNDIYFIDFDRVQALKSKHESARDKLEKELIKLLSFKTTKKLVDIKMLLGRLYLFTSESVVFNPNNILKEQLQNRNLITKEPFYIDEQIYFINSGELEAIKLKENRGEYEDILLRLISEESNAILQIDDFNTSSSMIPTLILKEGWLSIKSNKF